MVMPAPAPIFPDQTRRNWIVEELHALPDDGNRYEIVDGELLVTPAPSLLHQYTIVELLPLLLVYARAHDMKCVVSPADVIFSQRRAVQPDLFVLPLVDGRQPVRFTDVGRLHLAVEVISPSSVRADRYVKRRLYQSEAVDEYWIVEPETRCVERWRPSDEEPEVLVESLVWTPREGVEPLVIDLAAMFRRVHGEE
jgi:Uma2 family endonuclease